jgi:hypothetical protein
MLLIHQEEVETKLPQSLMLAVGGGEWLASYSFHCPISTRQRVPGIDLTGGWMDCTTCLDVVVKKNILPQPDI